MKRPGVLRIVDLELQAVVGILEHERKSPQKILISAEIEVDFNAASAAGENLDSGLDYFRFAEYLKSRIISGKYGLLEQLLMDVGDSALAEFPAILRLNLSIKKVAAIPGARFVEAQMEFRKKGNQLS